MATDWNDFEAVEEPAIDWNEFEAEPPLANLAGQRVNLPRALQGVRESRIGPAVFGKPEAGYELAPGAALRNVMDSPVMPEIYTPGVSYVPGMVKAEASPFQPPPSLKLPSPDEELMKPLVNLVPENPAFAPAVVKATSDPRISPEQRATRIARLEGVSDSMRDTVNFFTSPFGLATLGIANMPKMAQSAISAAFAVHMGSQVPEIARELGAELGKPEAERDQKKIANLVTTAATTTGFSALAGAHAAKPGVQAIQERREAFLGEPAPRVEPRFQARTTDIGIEAPATFGEVPPGIVKAPPGIDIQAPTTLPMTRQETARQAAIRNFNERLDRMKFKGPKPTVPEGPEIGAELTTQPTPGMRQIKEPGSYDEFLSDLVGKVTPDMTVRQVQELYPGAFKRGDALINKEAAGELLSDAKKSAHPVDWMEQELNAGKKVSTEAAYDIGMKVRSIEDLERLLKYSEQTQAQNKAAIAAGDVKALFKPRNMQVQIPREAIEAALGVGSAKTHPGLPENRPLDVRSFPEAREWWKKNAKRFGEEIEQKRKEEFGETEATAAEAPKPEVPMEPLTPAVVENPPKPGSREAESLQAQELDAALERQAEWVNKNIEKSKAPEPGFLNVPRSKWTVDYLEALGPTGRAPVIRQAIAALKDVGGKTKLGENATPQTLLKAVNEIMDLRAKQQAEKPVTAPVAPVTPPPGDMVKVYHGEGGAEGAGLGGFSVTEIPEYAAAFGPRQSVVEVPRAVLEQMKEEARQRGEPTNLILPEEYQKQMRPVEKPIEPPVTETSFITKEAVEASKGNLTESEVDELGRLLTAEEFGMLDAAQTKRLAELRQKSEAPTVPEAPAKPPEVTAPPSVTPERSAKVALPKAGEDLFQVESRVPSVDAQRNEIIRILELLEEEGKFGKITNRKIPESEYDKISLRVANTLRKDWGEMLDLDQDGLIKILRNRLGQIEKFKATGEPGPNMSFASVPPPIEQAPNAGAARIRRLYRRYQDKNISEGDLLDDVENIISDYEEAFPESFKKSIYDYRNEVIDSNYEPKPESTEKFVADVEEFATGKRPETKPIEKKPTVAEEEAAARPDKAYFEKFRDLESKRDDAGKELAAANAVLEKARALSRSNKQRMQRVNDAQSKVDEAQNKVDSAWDELNKLRTERQVESYDWDSYVKWGKELPPEREVNYGTTPKPAETKPPVAETAPPVPESKPAPAATEPPVITIPESEGPKLEKTYLADKLSTSNVYEHGGKKYVVNGIAHKGQTGQEFTAFELVPKEEWKGETFASKKPIYDKMQKGEIQRGDHTGLIIKVKGKEYVLANQTTFSWTKEAKAAPAVEPKWNGLTIEEIRKKLPIGFDSSTARIEGDRVIAKEKPEYGGREMYVDIKKGEAEPVTPEVTEKPAEQPAQKPDRGLYGSEDFELLSVKRANVKAELDKLTQENLDLEAEHTALYKANASEKKMTLNKEKRTEVKRKFGEKLAELQDIEGTIGLARMRKEAEAFKGKTVPAGTQNITNKMLKAQKQDLMQKVDEAIKEAPEDSTEKITISVEGDGEFTIANTKESLKKFKGIADKQFPETVGGISQPGLPSGKGRAIPAAKDPKPEDLGKIAGEFVSEDKSRQSILNSYADGTQIVATDGRQMIRIVTDKAPGSPDAPVRLTDKGKVNPDAEGRFPNWKIIADPKAELLLGGMDTAELAHIAHQAKAFRDTTADPGTKAQHGVEIYVNKDRTLGGRMRIVDELYEHNVQEGAAFAGLYNPDYISAAMNAARRLGNEKVDVYAHGGDSGPLGFNGKNFEYVVMPMRVEKGSVRAEATKFLPVAGKAVHGKLPEGYGPIENPLDALTDQSEVAGGGTYKTTVQGDTIRFDEIKTRSESSRSRGESATFEEKVAEIELSKLPESDKSQQAMIAEAIEPYTGKTGAKAIARALQTDLSNILARRRKMERDIQERKGEATKVMPPGPGAASPSEFAQRELESGRTPPEPPRDNNPGVPIDGGEIPTPEIVRKANDFGILNRLNSGQWTFYFGRLGQAAKAAWERMALGEFKMRENIQRDIADYVDAPLKQLPREFQKDGGKLFAELLDGRTLESIESEYSGRPKGDIVIEQARRVKTRLEEIRTTMRDIKRDSYRAALMSMEKATLERLYEENIFPDTQGKPKQDLADALTLDQFPDDWGIADGSYLPHMFFGQWKITARIPGMEQPQFITRAKTPAEAKARIFELTQRNPEYRNADFTIEQDMVIPADMIRLGDGQFWRLIAQMKERSQMDMNPKEAIQGIIGRKSSKQKYFGNTLHRTGALGYSKQYRQLMTAYLSGFHRWKELTAMNRDVQPLIEQVKREGRTNAAGRLQDIMDNLWGKPSQMTLDFDAFMRDVPVLRDIVKPLALDRWARFINTTITNLTLRTVRFGVVNRLQPLQGLYPLIGEKLMVKAKLLQHSAEGKRLLEQGGVTSDVGQYASEISSASKFSKGVERLTGEKSNQELAFLGMYLHGIEKGLDRAGAIRYAKLRGQLMTQFHPLVVDTPPIMEGPLGRVTFQFKRFPVKQLELLTQMAMDRNVPGLVRYFAVMAAMGGIALGLKQVYADKEKRLKVKRTLNKALGEKGADYMFYGLPGLAGADLSGSLMLGDEPFGANFPEKLGRTVMGPAPTIAYETGKAIMTPAREAMGTGEKAIAIARKIPTLRQLVDFYDLVRGSTDVTSPDGETKYRRKMRDVILGMGSFRSANEANIQLAVSGAMEIEKESSKLKNAIWVASQSRDNSKVTSAREDIKKFNERWPELAITPEELQKYFTYRKGNQPKTDTERALGKKYRVLMPR